jgi:F0F1-type ATP synthase assembly protein I
MDKPKQQESRLPDKDGKTWLTYSGMAFEMFAITGAFTALGWFLDKKLHTAPILILIFLLIGLSAAFYRIMKSMNK